jgi:hypothetical protein
VNARRPTWQTIREWIPSDDAEPCADLFDQRTESGNPVELRRKTAPSSSAIPTEATERTARERSAARKMLGKAERTAMLATVAATHESRRNRILLLEISRAEQRHQRTSSSFLPSLPPDPLTPRRPSPF